jgi:hypothetical protein
VAHAHDEGLPLSGLEARDGCAQVRRGLDSMVAVHTDTVLPASGPSPGVIPNFSCGPVALMR